MLEVRTVRHLLGTDLAVRVRQVEPLARKNRTLLHIDCSLDRHLLAYSAGMRNGHLSWHDRLERRVHLSLVTKRSNVTRHGEEAAAVDYCSAAS